MFKKSSELKKRRMVAVHEAGHVVVMLELGRTFTTMKLGQQKDGSHGHVEGLMEEMMDTSPKEMKKTIMIALAGVISTELQYRGSFRDSGFSDNQIISAIITSHPSICGHRSVQGFMMDLRSETHDILVENKKSINIIADELSLRSELSYADVQEILKS